MLTEGGIFMTTITVGGKEVNLTNLHKIFWPEDGITKADYIKAVAEIAPYWLPHLKNRPLVLTRYPNGIHGKAFYQKNTPPSAPRWLKLYRVYSPDSKRVINYVVGNDLATLIWLANQAAIEIHPWMSRCDKPNYPDFAIFDLDPMEGTEFSDAAEIAFFIREALQSFNLASYPKTSGATGLQVFVPVERKYTYDQLRSFVEYFARLAVKAKPRIATVERLVKKRGARVYVDYLQNIKGKTIASVYGFRPRPGAPVSCPVTWDELAKGITPCQYNIHNIRERLKQVGDLFAPVLNQPQNLDHVFAFLEGEGKKLLQ